MSLKIKLSLDDDYLTFKAWDNNSNTISITSNVISERAAWNYAAVSVDNGTVSLILNNSVKTIINPNPELEELMIKTKSYIDRCYFKHEGGAGERIADYLKSMYE